MAPSSAPMFAPRPSLLVFALVSALVFAAGDFVVIPLVMRPLFKSALGDQMLDTLRLWPAALFYLIHLAGLTYFAGLAVLRGAGPSRAFLDGAILGLVAYSCYEMTSFTIMRDWTLELVLVDIGWGMLISGLAAAAGAAAARRFHRR
jgi:uncharacterized membrane protein